VCLICVITETPKRGDMFQVSNERKMNECLPVYLQTYLMHLNYITCWSFKLKPRKKICILVNVSLI
jgi:hypothetical protein